MVEEARYRRGDVALPWGGEDARFESSLRVSPRDWIVCLPSQVDRSSTVVRRKVDASVDMLDRDDLGAH